MRATWTLIGVAALVAGCDAAAGGDDSGGDDGDSVPAGAYCDGVADWDASRAAAEEEVVRIVNQKRAQGADCGGEGAFPPAPALTMNAALRCAARVHTADMAERGFFDHTNPDGESSAARITKAGYRWMRAGENIAQGSRTADSVMDGWMGSDGHCANIMSDGFVHIGVGYVEGANLWTQTFGKPF
jgi:uncharacterized protein YkwD